MTARGKRYFTQWAAQFYAAAELTRRGYLVAFTLGNAPESDLFVRTPQGIHFEVDVKGLSSHNFWLIQERDPRPDLFYILVHVPASLAPAEFFILSSTEAMSEIATLRQATISAGREWVASGAGFPWQIGAKHTAGWSLLPA